MKSLKILSILVFLLTFQSGYSQLSSIIPKPDLIKSLDDVSDLGFSKDKNDKLFEQNESFVNDLFDIVDSDKSEEDKKSALGLLKKENDSKLENLLGIEDAKKYKKKIKKTLKPYTRKMKLLKFAL